MSFDPALIAVVDIGSPEKGRLGWATLPNGNTGKSLAPLIEGLAAGLRAGPIAVGFESPMWVPLRSEEMTLTKSRKGEGSRAWSASAGAGVLCTGLAVVSYILAELKKAVPNATAYLDYENPPQQPFEILFWEAFVSGTDKRDSHENDAMVAAVAFQKALADLAGHQKLASEPSLNLLGTMLLRTGWSKDLLLLESELLVLQN